MADLFLHTDDRFLRSKWDFAFAVFQIVARDYQAVLAGTRPQDRHRTILMQTASDLLDVEADLHRLGLPSPAEQLVPEELALWDAVAILVRELRQWRIPREDMPVAEIEAALYRRKVLEERFNATLQRVGGGDQTPAPCVTVVLPAPSA